MPHLAVKVAVLESELGYGSKIDDWMVCLTMEDAYLFKQEFNAKNNSPTVPSWYMKAIDEPVPVDLNDKQHEMLKSENRIWLSSLNRI